MLMWTVTAVQILAILVCHLTCVSGHACCGADEVLALASSSPTAVETPSCDRCCCKQESQQEQQTPPVAPSDQNNCQGVCGGAIFEKSCELPVENSLFTALPLAEGVSPLTLVELPADDSSEIHLGSGNYGRSLRTRHASFLC